MTESPCIPLLKALADETRWCIVRQLLTGSLTVGELVDQLQISQYNISKHVRILREAGILRTERKGKHVLCHVTPEFKTRLAQEDPVLDLGCCSFRF
jgi:DNA-binding transcriptional ArsR family regulator